MNKSKAILTLSVLCSMLLVGCQKTPPAISGDVSGRSSTDVAIKSSEIATEVNSSSAEMVSQAEWGSYTRTSHYVELEDGVKMAVDVFLPTDYQGQGEAPNKFPTVLRYSPYQRSSIDLETGDVLLRPVFEYFIPRGYAFVSADMRGSGASFGWNTFLGEAFAGDAKVLIDWIAGQPWSTAKVGMMGVSYDAWSQYAAASAHPEALKAIVPTHAGWGRESFLPGGIKSYAFMELWTSITDFLVNNSVYKHIPFQPATPVIDEDGDGELLDEIPVDVDNSGWFTDDYAWPVDPQSPPQYSDGVAREHHYYYNATMEHVAHPDGAPGNHDAVRDLHTMVYSDQNRLSDGLTDLELGWGLMPKMLDSGVAVYHMNGWFDASLNANMAVHNAFAERGVNARVSVMPNYHGGMSEKAGSYLGANMAEDTVYSPGYLMEHLRWFDRWLKGIDNGIDKEPPVRLFVMNEGWRYENEWPLKREVRHKLFFGADNKLVNTAPLAGADEYKADLSHNASFSPFNDGAPITLSNTMKGKEAFKSETYGGSRQMMMVVPDDVPYRTEQESSKTLVYTGDVLAEDTEVTGYPIVSVWVSSTADHGDLYFYLEDVDENAKSVLVTQYQHRVGFNTEVSSDDPSIGMKVRYNLPVYSFKQEDYTDGIFADGNVVKVKVALQPTSWVFKKGHKVRLSIAAADWPDYVLHPKLSPSNDPKAEDNIVPTLKFLRGGDFPASLDLPVIPISLNGSWLKNGERVTGFQSLTKIGEPNAEQMSCFRNVQDASLYIINEHFEYIFNAVMAT